MLSLHHKWWQYRAKLVKVETISFAQDNANCVIEGLSMRRVNVFSPPPGLMEALKIKMGVVS
jgi:hypothetical protein